MEPLLRHSPWPHSHNYIKTLADLEERVLPSNGPPADLDDIQSQGSQSARDPCPDARILMDRYNNNYVPEAYFGRDTACKARVLGVGTGHGSQEGKGNEITEMQSMTKLTNPREDDDLC